MLRKLSLILIIFLALGCSIDDKNRRPIPEPPPSSSDRDRNNARNGSQGSQGRSNPSSRSLPRVDDGNDQRQEGDFLWQRQNELDSDSEFTHLRGIKIVSNFSNYRINVIDAEKLSLLINEENKIVVSGNILNSREYPDDQITCSVQSLYNKNKFISQDELRDQSLTIERVIDEMQYQGLRSDKKLSMTFNEIGIAIHCLNPKHLFLDFSWFNLQTSFTDILAVEHIPQQTISPVRSASDQQGRCSADLLKSHQDLESETTEMSNKAVRLSHRLYSAKSDQEKNKISNEIQQQTRSVLRLCNEFESQWGEFSCLIVNANGKSTQVNSLEFMKNCNETRAVLF